MTDPAPLLAAVIASPEDDGPREVYADWLEEHGECDRAEFIRVQCELAAGPTRLRIPNSHTILKELSYGGSQYTIDDDIFCDRKDCRWCLLRSCERELLTHDNVIRWAGPLDGIKPASHYRDFAGQDIGEALAGRAPPTLTCHGAWQHPEAETQPC